MGIEENKEVVQRLFEEVRNGQNYDNIHELIHPDFEYAIWKGPEGFKENAIMWRTAFPDLKRTIIEILAENEVVSVLDEFDGTFTGEFAFGLKPTGNHVNHVMTHFFRFKEGKVVEMIPTANTVGVYRQMGVEPPPEAN